jgi:hypothetical protein
MGYGVRLKQVLINAAVSRILSGPRSQSKFGHLEVESASVSVVSEDTMSAIVGGTYTPVPKPRRNFSRRVAV